MVSKSWNPSNMALSLFKMVKILKSRAVSTLTWICICISETWYWATTFSSQSINSITCYVSNFMRSQANQVVWLRIQSTKSKTFPLKYILIQAGRLNCCSNSSWTFESKLPPPQTRMSFFWSWSKNCRLTTNLAAFWESVQYVKVDLMDWSFSAKIVVTGATISTCCNGGKCIERARVAAIV